MRLNSRTVLVFFFLILAAAAACRKGPTASTEVVAVPVQALPSDPGNASWEKAPEYAAALLPQDVVDPRLMKTSTQQVRVRAVSDGSALGVRLEWIDLVKNDLPGPGLSVDSCALQLPKTIGQDPPSNQMGEAKHPVEITFWRSDWQATVNGRGGSIRDLYPNAAVDHYPFQAPPLDSGSPDQQAMAQRFAPAQALGNRRNGPRESPIEDLVGEGPGTLRPETRAGSKGKGLWTEKGWVVVLSRRLPAGLMPGLRTQIAFAIWDGAHGEIGSRKMRTGWIPLLRQGAL